MYERNAIVIDRYFSELLGYGEKSNLKNNYQNYIDLIKKLEKYQETSKAEDEIMNEFEKIANQIKETQKVQELLYKKSLKHEENRKDLFDTLDEEAENLRKKFEKVENDITKNQEEIKENTEKFISEIAEFNEKSTSRIECGRERRVAESEYQKQLNETITNFQAINSEKVTIAKEFYKKDNNEIVSEISEKIIKNGEKEKVPFNKNVIEKAVQIQTEMEEKIVETLCISYDRTTRLLSEIKSDNIKLEKHKKTVKDSESKLKFLNAVKEYIILFLDNERLNVVGGEKEHKKLMDNACKNVDKDMVEIKNLYELILKEILGKSTKKAYKEMYKPEYLLKLEDGEKEFEKDVSKLNMIGTIIYPDYWRVDGMKKIFDAFRTIITETYEKDLTEYEPFTTNIEDVYKVEEENQIQEEKSELDKFYIEDMWNDDDFDEDDYDDDSDDGEEDYNDSANDENDKHDIEDELDEDLEDSTEFDYDDIDFEDEDTDDDFDFDFGDDDESKEDDDDYEENYEDDENDYQEEDNNNSYVDDKDREIDEILGFFNDDYNYITSDDNESNEDKEENDEEDNDMGLDLNFGYEDFEEELKEDKKNLRSRKSNKKPDTSEKSSKIKNKKSDFEKYEEFKNDMDKIMKNNRKSFFKKK